MIVYFICLAFAAISFIIPLKLDRFRPDYVIADNATGQRHILLLESIDSFQYRISLIVGITLAVSRAVETLLDSNIIRREGVRIRWLLLLTLLVPNALVYGIVIPLGLPRLWWSILAVRDMLLFGALTTSLSEYRALKAEPAFAVMTALGLAEILREYSLGF